MRQTGGLEVAGSSPAGRDGRYCQALPAVIYGSLRFDNTEASTGVRTAVSCLRESALVYHLMYNPFGSRMGHTPSQRVGRDFVLADKPGSDDRRWQAEEPTRYGKESPRIVVAGEALPHAKSLCHVLPTQMKALCEEIVSVLRRVRARVSRLSDEKVLEGLFQEIRTAQLTPGEIASRLAEQPVSKMATYGKPSAKKSAK